MTEHPEHSQGSNGSEPPDLGVEIDIDDAAREVIAGCIEEQEPPVVVPVEAIDEIVMPERLPPNTPHDVWDMVRLEIRDTITNEGYEVV